MTVHFSPISHTMQFFKANVFRAWSIVLSCNHFMISCGQSFNGSHNLLRQRQYICYIGSSLQQCLYVQQYIFTLLLCIFMTQYDMCCHASIRNVPQEEYKSVPITMYNCCCYCTVVILHMTTDVKMAQQSAWILYRSSHIRESLCTSHKSQ